MSEFVGFLNMVILDPYTIDAVGVFGLAFQILFKSDSYCAEKSFDIQAKFKNATSICTNELKDKFLRKEDVSSNCAQCSDLRTIILFGYICCSEEF